MTPHVAVTAAKAVAPQIAQAPAPSSIGFSQMIGSGGFMALLNANDSATPPRAPQPSQPKNNGSDTNSQNTNLAGTAGVTAPQQPAATTQPATTSAAQSAAPTTPTPVSQAAVLVPALPQTASTSGTNSTGSNGQGTQTVPGAAAIEARVSAGAPTYLSQPNTMLAGLWHHAGPAQANDATQDGQDGTAQADDSSASQANGGSADPAADQTKLANVANAAGQDAHDASNGGASQHTPDDVPGQAVAAQTTPDATAAALPAPNAAIHQTLAATPAATTSATNTTALPIPAHVLPAGEQVALSMRQAAQSGTDRIEIQLKPASLGAIAVKLDVSHDGHISAVISADRSDTLNLLKQDSQGLQQALRDAGLKADSGSLSFNLRGGDPQSYAQNQAPAFTTQRYADAATPAATSQPTAQANYRRHDGTLDIEV